MPKKKWILPIALISLSFVAIFIFCQETVKKQTEVLQNNEAAFTAESNMGDEIFIQKIDVTKILGLESALTYSVFDYYEGKALLLVGEKEKRNAADVSDQSVTTYYDFFTILDIDKKVELKRYSLNHFCICTGALMTADGIVCSMYFNDVGLEGEKGLFFLDDDGLRRAYAMDFSVFDVGPLLRRCEDRILFSFHSAADDKFGISEILPSCKVAPVMTFPACNGTSFLTWFSVIGNQIVCALEESGQTVFYIGADELHSTKISPELKAANLLGCDITDHELIIVGGIYPEKITENRVAPYVETYDIKSGQITGNYILPIALVGMKSNSCGLICGFDIAGKKQLKLFALRDGGIQEVILEDAMLQEYYGEILSDGLRFLVTVKEMTSDSRIMLWELCEKPR